MRDRSLNILFAINQLSVFAGGSLVPLEIAQTFVRWGHDCTIAANYIDNPLQEIAIKSGIRVTENVPNLNAFDYDIVWCQNHTAPLLQYSCVQASKERTVFVFAHLSTTTYLEAPGIVLEPLLGDAIFANAEATREYLLDLGIEGNRLGIFPNPAPAWFWRDRPIAIKPKLSTVLLISNHPAPETLEALTELQRKGIRTRLIGRGGDAIEVTPGLLERASAIITIGKSVQYALAMGLPAFVYDRYGGPGYLNKDNFRSAADENFSGRCCRRVLNASDLATEIVDNFMGATKFVRDLGPERLAQYRLDTYLNTLVELLPSRPSNGERLAAMNVAGPVLMREKLMASAIRENFAGHVRSNAKVKKLARHLEKIKDKR